MVLAYLSAVRSYGKIGFSGGVNIEQLVFNEMGLCGIFSPKQYPEIVTLVEQLFRELLENNHRSPYHAEFCSLYVYQLFISLARLSAALPKLKIECGGNLQSVSHALDTISQSVRSANVPSVEMLASSCNMSVSNFRKVFRKVTGHSPKDYITKCFVNKAQQLLLTTDKSISDICAESGFGDISWFNRQFFCQNEYGTVCFQKKIQQKYFFGE